MEQSLFTAGCNSLLNRRQELNALIDKMEKERNAIDKKIKLEMQDAAYGIAEPYRVSWVSSDTTRLDTTSGSKKNSRTSITSTAKPPPAEDSL